MHFALLAVSALAASVAAIPASTHVLHEKRSHVPHEWEKRSKVASTAKMPMRVGLTQRNLERGYDLLMEVSKHDSPKYGQHYTAEEVIDLFAPHEDSVSAVKNWLVSSGIGADRVSQSANKQWIQFDATAAEAESLLQTEYHLYEHAGTGKTTVACDEYHVPQHVTKHIDYITPGIRLMKSPVSRKDAFEKRSASKKRSFKRPPLLKSMPSIDADVESLRKSNTSSCDSIATPACIAALYNITAGTLSAKGNELGIFEDLGDVYAQEDLDAFFTAYYPTIPTGTGPTLDAVDGAVAPYPQASAGAESDLDFQISYPIIYPQNSILYQTDDMYYEENYSFEGFFNTFLDAIDGSYCIYSAYGETGDSSIDPSYPDTHTGGYKSAEQCGVYTPTNVISISYGGQEYDTPAAYQERQCNEWMKLGLQGVSVVVASGDSGVAGPNFDDSINGCINRKIFSPDFPATCPYITTVGATYLPTGADVNTDAEVAVSRFPSGGGFSNIFGTADYQADAVATFFETANLTYAYYSGLNYTNFGNNSGIYNRIGRGYPDVGAIGDNVAIYYGGQAELIGGTSAAAPTFAAILTRINEERIAAGKSTVGFVNPTLYANPQVLHDITSGSNPGCGTDGFPVTTGWDPVTGLGTPNYPAMLELFLSLD